MCISHSLNNKSMVSADNNYSLLPIMKQYSFGLGVSMLATAITSFTI